MIFERDGEGRKDIYLVPSEVTQSLVVWLLKTTAAIELELVLWIGHILLIRMKLG